jgi:release factor glutamine methyltransferase
MYTVGEVLNRTAKFLEDKGFENSRLNAEVMLGHVLEVSRIGLYLDYDRPLSDAQLGGYRTLVKQRLSGRPLQYVTGSTEFYSLNFEVTPAVLIPRPETEILVEAVVKRLAPLQEALEVADIGTGCGIIAVTLAAHLPQARIWATDRSAEALAVAKANAARHGVSDRIRFAQGDLLAPLSGREHSLAAVASNPPYIPTPQLRQLPVEIRDHEPIVALDGGPDGLDVIRRLISRAAGFLSPGGLFALEVGAGQAGPVAGILERQKQLRPEGIVRDYAGHDRVVLARRSSDD